MRILLSVFIVLGMFIAANAQAKEFEQGVKNAGEGLFEEALIKFEISLAKTNDAESLARLYYNIGVCRFQLNQTVEAVESFEKAIKLSSGKYQRAYYALGMANSRVKNWRAAREAFQNAISLKKNDGEAWFDLAMVLIEEKEYETASRAFQQAIKHNSVSAPDAHNNLGVIYALQGDFKAAQREFEIALKNTKGELLEAKNNLEFCRSYQQTKIQNLLAKLEFTQNLSAN
jgi:tetratricopeptide (TPR) repeat protein